MRRRFNKKYRVYDVCDQCGMRLALTYVHFNNGYAYASDGHILVRVPLSSLLPENSDEERDGLNGFSINWKTLRTIYNYDFIKVERDNEADTCRIVIYQDDNMLNEISFKLRKTESIDGLPDMEKVLAASNDAEPVSRIGISPERLAKLCKAIAIDKIVVLKFYGERKAIRVTNIRDGSLAIIMPMII